MDEAIKQIAERLRGLRDVLELTTEEVARDCGIKQNEYEQAETGNYDISVSMLQKIARHYHIALDEPNDNPIHYNTHEGQEFNLIIQGRMLISVGGKELILNEGDSLYFNSALPHGMKALDGKTVKFLAIIL